MTLYDKWILAPLTDLSMRQRQLAERRARLLEQAHGRVLEIGSGSGLNLEHYRRDVTELHGIDPSAELLDRARGRAHVRPFKTFLHRGTAEHLPFADATFDTAVVTWSLCSIPAPLAALREVRRVLKPGRALLFVEHGLAPEARVAAWQRRLTPLWRRLAGNCHLDRKPDELIRQAGFALNRIEPATRRAPAR